MDLSNVDVGKIYDIMQEISSVTGNINDEVDKISNSCEGLITDCKTLSEYNKQEVVGSKHMNTIMKEQHGEQVYSHTEVIWNEWNISGHDSIISSSDYIIDTIMDNEPPRGRAPRYLVCP